MYGCVRIRQWGSLYTKDYLVNITLILVSNSGIVICINAHRADRCTNITRIIANCHCDMFTTYYMAEKLSVTSPALPEADRQSGTDYDNLYTSHLYTVIVT